MIFFDNSAEYFSLKVFQLFFYFFKKNNKTKINIFQQEIKGTFFKTNTSTLYITLFLRDKLKGGTFVFFPFSKYRW